MKKILIVLQIICLSVAGFSVKSSAEPTVSVQEDHIEVFDVTDRDLSELCRELSLKTGEDISVDPGVSAKITMYVEDVSFEELLGLIADSRGLAYAKVSGSGTESAYRFMTLGDYERQQGRFFSWGMTSKMMTLQKVKPSQIVSYLNNIKSPTGKILAYDKKSILVLMDQPDKMTNLQDAVKAMDVKTEMRTFEFSNIPEHQLLDFVRSQLTPHIGRVDLHQASQKITVTDTQEVLNMIAQWIESSENASRSVVVDVRVMQIILSEEHRNGVEWPAVLSNYKSMRAEGFHGESDWAQHFSIGTVSDADAEVLRESLDVVGALENVSSETVTVANGASSKFDVKYVDLKLSNSFDEDLIRVMRHDGISFGLSVNISGAETMSLGLTPLVSAYQKQIWMNKFYMKSSEDVSGASQDALTVDLVPGETLIIGGLFKDVRVESSSKVPLLGKLPWLGIAFRKQDRETRKAEMVIFLTPRLFKND